MHPSNISAHVTEWGPAHAKAGPGSRSYGNVCKISLTLFFTRSRKSASRLQSTIDGSATVQNFSSAP